MHKCELYENRISVKTNYTNTVIANGFKQLYGFGMIRRSTPSTQFQIWLREGLNQPGKSVTGLAQFLRVAQPRVSEMLHGKRRPQASELATIAEYIGQRLPEQFVPKGEAVLHLPVISVVNAGKLVNQFDPEDIRRTVRVCDMDPKGDWLALEVEGDSMDRISPPGSVILVNRNEKKLTLNALYVVADETGAATYKRFRNKPDRFEPVSTNPEHSPIFPDGNITIVGRVRRSILDTM